MFLIFLLAFLSVQEARSFTDIRQYSMENWTSCETFLKNTAFDKKSLIDVDWKIFYFWCFDYEISYNVKFSYPSRELVRRFREALDEELLPMVEWDDAELFMETAVDFCALLIRLDEPGQYRLIPSSAFNYKNSEEDRSVELMTYAFKVVEPGYLGIMNCDQRLCFALAPNDKMPKDEEIVQAAKKIGFWNPLGRSYLVQPQGAITPAPLISQDDADDDVELEIDTNPDVMQSDGRIDDE